MNARRPSLAWLALSLAWAACDGPGAVGTLRVHVSGGNEATSGVPATATDDGWSVRFTHVALQLEQVLLRTTAGEDAAIPMDPVVVELTRGSALAFTLAGVPAQRWDRFGWRSRPVGASTENLGVDAAVLERMRERGFSLYLEGSFVAPAGTVDAEGAPVTEVPFALGVPVEADYERCVNGTDGSSGVVVPLNSATDAEVTWHLTHAFFDSFAEDASLRVEPFAALWPRERPVETDDLDVSLASLRGMNGRSLRDREGNPVVYLAGMTGATTLREFFLNARYGHFNGLVGFCATDLRLLD